jgi:hypothetical protein
MGLRFGGRHEVDVTLFAADLKPRRAPDVIMAFTIP